MWNPAPNHYGIHPRFGNFMSHRPRSQYHYLQHSIKNKQFYEMNFFLENDGIKQKIVVDIWKGKRECWCEWLLRAGSGAGITRLPRARAWNCLEKKILARNCSLKSHFYAPTLHSYTLSKAEQHHSTPIHYPRRPLCSVYEVASCPPWITINVLCAPCRRIFCEIPTSRKKPVAGHVPIKDNK